MKTKQKAEQKNKKMAQRKEATKSQTATNGAKVERKVLPNGLMAPTEPVVAKNGRVYSVAQLTAGVSNLRPCKPGQTNNPLGRRPGSVSEEKQFRKHLLKALQAPGKKRETKFDEIMDLMIDKIQKTDSETTFIALSRLCMEAIDGRTMNQSGSGGSAQAGIMILPAPNQGNQSIERQQNGNDSNEE